MEDKVIGLGGREFHGEERQWRPGTSDLLLEDGAQVGLRGVNSKGNRSSRFRMYQHRHRGEKQLGMVEGGVKHREPGERFPRTLEGVGETS